MIASYPESFKSFLILRVCCTQIYRYNLEVLRKFNNTNFPLKKYIVDVDRDISPPSYISQNTMYRLSNGLPPSNPIAGSCKVQILNKNSWQSHYDFGLNESQYKAFRAALTKQLVIIQGAPGNGIRE